ncbi:rRNA maturation RNase YbeY [Frateuria aurantia]
MNKRASETPQLELAVSYGLPRKGLPSSPRFRGWVEAALRGAGRRKPTAVAIRLVDTEEGRELNHQYRDKDYATNVLSFPAEFPPGVDLPLIGDLAISAPVVAREAAEQGKPELEHWAHLTVHGTLHLLGYDHIDEAEAEAMEALETRILAGLGIADPYLLRD